LIEITTARTVAIKHSCIAKRLADLCYLVRHLRCAKQALNTSQRLSCMRAGAHGVPATVQGKGVHVYD